MKTMGDEDDGNALGGHIADGVQQRFGFLLRQHGGGLVQDQQLQVFLAELAGDFGKLLVAHRHAADDHFLVDLNAHFFDGALGAHIHFLIIESVHSIAEHF